MHGEALAQKTDGGRRFAPPAPDRVERQVAGVRQPTAAGARQLAYGSLLSSDNTFCGIELACESIAVPACCTICAWVSAEVAWA